MPEVPMQARGSAARLIPCRSYITHNSGRINKERDARTATAEPTTSSTVNTFSRLHALRKQLQQARTKL
jgi:hypothetical protein